MEVVVEAGQGHSVGDASMEYGGVDERVCLCSPFLPPIPIMQSNGGSSLTALCFCCSLRLHPDYSSFRSEVEKFLRLPDAAPTTGEREIDTALEVLQAAMEAEKNEDHEEIGSGDQDKDMVDEVGRPLALTGKVENALKILVHNATEEFGFSPRDVYDGVFRLCQTRDEHAAAVADLNYTKLREIVRSFSRDRGITTESSHHVVVVFPRPLELAYPFDRDHWTIDFKSIRIAREVMKSMQLQEIEHLREMYQLFHRFPGSSTLAGWVFEVIVHRSFSDGWRSGPVPQPILMKRKGSSRSPVFFTDTSSSTPNTPSPLRVNARAITEVNFAPRELSGVTLDNDRYYIPSAANHPLFDSFTIDVISPNGVIPATGVISIF